MRAGRATTGSVRWRHPEGLCHKTSPRRILCSGVPRQPADSDDPRSGDAHSVTPHVQEQQPLRRCMYGQAAVPPASEASFRLERLANHPEELPSDWRDGDTGSFLLCRCAFNNTRERNKAVRREGEICICGFIQDCRSSSLR